MIQPCFSKTLHMWAKNSLMEKPKSIEGTAVSCNNMACFVVAPFWMGNVNKAVLYFKKNRLLCFCADLQNKDYINLNYK